MSKSRFETAGKMLVMKPGQVYQTGTDPLKNAPSRATTDADREMQASLEAAKNSVARIREIQWLSNRLWARK